MYDILYVETYPKMPTKFVGNIFCVISYKLSQGVKLWCYRLRT